VVLFHPVNKSAMRFLLSVTGMIFLTGILGVAQQQTCPQSDDMLRVNTDLVRTYITVIDEQGHFVDGLAPRTPITTVKEFVNEIC
jgi:hypothetical protein